ncbi:MAG: hypothetical protein MHPSP_002843, partial [Paramarteilia canceri]
MEVEEFEVETGAQTENSLKNIDVITANLSETEKKELDTMRKVDYSIIREEIIVSKIGRYICLAIFIIIQ